MASAAEQARQEVDASRHRLDVTLDQLESRLRLELNPRRRLRRDAPRLVAVGLVVAVAATLYVVRQRRHHEEARELDADWIHSMPEDWRRRLQELLAEAAVDGRLGVEAQPPRRQLSGLQGLALKAGRLAAPVVIGQLAKRASRDRGA